MKNFVKASLVLLSATLGLSACGSPSTVSLENNNGNASFTAAADSTTANANGKAGKPGKGFKGGKEGKGGLGFGQFPGVELTAEQKTALAALRPQQEAKDPATMKANMEAAQKALKDAFLADSINKDDLKAKLAAFEPPAPDFAKQADTMIKAYNILTAEQKATLETKEAEMQAKAEQMKADIEAKIAAGTIKKPEARTDVAKKGGDIVDKFGTDLGLTDAQKASLKEALTPAQPTQVSDADRQAQHDKMKQIHADINAAVKAGDVAKLTELLSAQKRPDNHTDAQVDKIVKIHDILTAEQRSKVVDKLPLFGHGFGPGGFGGHGGPGGFGGRGGDKMGGHGGPGGHGKGFAKGAPQAGQQAPADSAATTTITATTI